MRVFISGIGGSGAYYLAKYYLLLGYEVFGSDCNKNARIESLNISKNIFIGADATDFIKSVSPFDMYIYSPAFDVTHPERVYFASQNVDVFEVGQLTDKLIGECLSCEMDAHQKECAIKSELLILAAIDWSAKKYIAVTGTDGKTTTVSMIYHILKKNGVKVAVISTVGMFISTCDEVVDTGFHTTTPSSQELYKLLTSEKLKDIDVIILETTSHSLAMGRVAMSQFDVVAVTNVTSEHLDYHKTWDNYFTAKARLLTEHVKPSGLAVLNSHDELSFSRLKRICDVRKIKYVINDGISEKITLNPTMDTWYNRDNASLALLICNYILGRELSYDQLADFEGVNGRMEYLKKEPFCVIVDFAHTANALDVLLTSLQQRLTNKGKIHVVFGCAGMRDRTKRQPMGHIAFQLADNIYVCPEDPRTEHLLEIDRQILTGMELDIDKFDGQELDGKVRTFEKNGKKIKVYLEESIESRKQAIADAIKTAQKDDIVVVCGKGHEQSMCFGITEYLWSDQEQIKKIL